MGATVTTGKEICAIRDPRTNEVVYLLFEEAYDKRTFPHRPKWGCYAIGGIREIMRHIFLAASSCEGGMLQNRSGDIRPEGYIQGWMKALAEPRAYPDVPFELSMGNDWRHLLKPSEIAELKQRLEGNQKAIEMIASLEQSETGRVQFQLHECIGELAAILSAANKSGHLIAWRLPCLEHDASLAYAPKKASRFDVTIPEVLRVGEYNHLMKVDGLWRSAGWAYSLVGSYIANLWEAEIKEPGSYWKRIRAYREAVKYCVEAPFPLRAHIDRSDLINLDRWEMESLRSFMDRLASVANDDGTYTVSESEIEDAIRSPRNAIIWEMTADPIPVQASFWEDGQQAA